MALSVTKFLLGITTPGGYTFVNSEAAALVARMTTPPTDERRRLIDQLVGRLKLGAVSGSNIWAKLDVLYVTAAADAQAARLNWVSASAFTPLVAFNSPTFTIDRGFAGNGTSSYHGTGWQVGVSADLASRDDNHLGSWALTNVANAGVDFGSNIHYINPRNGSGNFETRNMNAAANTVAAIGTSIGHSAMSRAAGAGYSQYKNGALIGSPVQASGAPVANEVGMGARMAGTTPSLFSTRQIAAAHGGVALTDNEMLDMYNALLAYLQAVGAA